MIQFSATSSNRFIKWLKFADFTDGCVTSWCICYFTIPFFILQQAYWCHFFLCWRFTIPFDAKGFISNMVKILSELTQLSLFRAPFTIQRFHDNGSLVFLGFFLLFILFRQLFSISLIANTDYSLKFLAFIFYVNHSWYFKVHY